MLNGFKEYLEDKRLSQNTIDSYFSDIKIFEEYYKDSYGEDLTILLSADIKMYKQYLLNKNILPKTINRKLTSLRTYNEFLVQKGIQTNIVILDKDYIKIQSQIINKEIPQKQEINKLKHYAAKDTKNGKRDYCFIILLTNGGFRESELVHIKISDIKLEERYINVLGKGNKFRQVIINNLMYDALTEYLQERKNVNTQNPYLFISQKTKSNLNPINRNFCNRLLNKYKELCKIAKLHPHLLRAFFCENALRNAGYTLDQVANQAGHNSLNTTKLYLGTNREDFLSLANKL